MEHSMRTIKIKYGLKLLIRLTPFETVVPMLGLGIKNSNTTTQWVECEVVPYDKIINPNIDYKVTIEPINKKLLSVYGKDEFYTSDLVRSIMLGNVKILDEVKYWIYDIKRNNLYQLTYKEKEIFINNEDGVFIVSLEKPSRKERLKAYFKYYS